MPSSLIAWRTFLDRCIDTRLDPDDFTTYVELLKTQEPLPAPRIVDLFLSPREENDVALDPRIVRYLQVLLSLELVSVPAVLRGLWKVSSFRTLEAGGADVAQSNDGAGKEEAAQKKVVKRWTNSYTTEETLFYRITKYISSGSAPRDLQETVELINVCIQWMETVVSGTHAANQILSLAPAHTTEMTAQHMALGTLVVSVVENARVVHALQRRAVSKPTRQHLGKALEGFVPLVLQSSPQSAARLEVFRTETLLAVEPVEVKEVKGGADKDIEDLLQEGLELGVESMVVEEMPVMNTRAGLYVYLNSLVGQYNMASLGNSMLIEDSWLPGP